MWKVYDQIMTKPLQTDNPLDGNLKPVKDTDGTISAIEVSTDEVRVKSLNVVDDIRVLGESTLVKDTLMKASASFTQKINTYDATHTTISFKEGNKQYLAFGSGNITNLNLLFPKNSGNFILLLKQDASGSRTITNYKAFDYDENAAAGSSTVKFAGGSNPTLTTTANKVDILSIYWDATAEIAYGTISLNF